MSENRTGNSDSTSARDLVLLGDLVEMYPWLNERWLRRIIQDKRIGTYRVGNRVLFDPAEFEAFVLSNRKDPES